MGLLVADLLVVLDDVTQMVTAAVVSLAHAHGVVRKVHIAVIACRCGEARVSGMSGGGFAGTYKRISA